MPITIDSPPLERDRFESALVDAVAVARADNTRFYRILMSGRCPPGMLLRYARSTHLSAQLFCASIAEMVQKAPDREARLTLLENLMEEEGVTLRPNRGLVVRGQDSHPALALRFLKACGGDPDAPLASPPALHATGRGRRWLAEGRWLEAVAFLLLGQEMRFANNAAQLAEGLTRNGLSRKDVAFFTVHIEADARHGREALDLVLDRAPTAELQQQAIDAARAGALEWLEFHGGALTTEARD